MVEGDTVFGQCRTFRQDVAVKSGEVHPMKLNQATVHREGQVTPIEPQGHVDLRSATVEQHLLKDAPRVVGPDEFNLNARAVGEVLKEGFRQRSNVVGQDAQHPVVVSDGGFELAAVLQQEQVFTKATAEACADEQQHDEDGPHAVASVT